MSDLIVNIPNHGLANDDEVFVSWLTGNKNRFISDKDQNSFKLATASGGSILEQFEETILSTSRDRNYVRETTSTSATTTISGLDHLEGESVQLTVSGAFIGLFTVSSGAITVPSAVYNEYNVGKQYISTLQPMKIDLRGTGLSTTKKLNRTVLSLHETVEGTIGSNTENVIPIAYREAGEPGEEFPYFTGDIEISLPGGYSREGDIVIQQNKPLPMTLLAFTIDVGASND